MSEWKARPDDLAWLLDQYKEDIERRVLAVGRENKTRKHLDHIATLCRDLSRETPTDQSVALVPESQP